MSVLRTPKPLMSFVLGSTRVRNFEWMMGYSNNDKNFTPDNFMGFKLADDAAMMNVVNFVKLQYQNVIVNKLVFTYSSFSGYHYFTTEPKPSAYQIGRWPPGLKVDEPVRRFEYLYDLKSSEPRGVERAKSKWINKKTVLRFTVYPRCKKVIPISGIKGTDTLYELVSAMGSDAVSIKKMVHFSPYFTPDIDFSSDHMFDVKGINCDMFIKVYCTASNVLSNNEM